MTRHLLITGATGALGPHLLNAQAPRITLLVRRAADVPSDPRFEAIVGDIADPRLVLPRSVDTIIHAAASTQFRAPESDLRRTNVAGTANLLRLAADLPRLRRLVHLSTTCVSGIQHGTIPEAPVSAAEFLNFYEQTKWEAEQLVLQSSLPVRIVRLSTCLGVPTTGHCRRPGAIHHALRWMSRGLIPIIPGAPQTPVDFIDSDRAAAAAILRAALSDSEDFRIAHVAAGRRAPSLKDFLSVAADEFSRLLLPWRRGLVCPPQIVDEDTFHIFRQTVRASGDATFMAVLDSTESFLPALLHRRTYDTTIGDTLHPPQSDWQTLLRRVIRNVLTLKKEAAHA